MGRLLKFGLIVSLASCASACAGADAETPATASTDIFPAVTVCTDPACAAAPGTPPHLRGYDEDDRKRIVKGECPERPPLAGIEEDVRLGRLTLRPGHMNGRDAPLGLARDATGKEMYYVKAPLRADVPVGAVVTLAGRNVRTGTPMVFDYRYFIWAPNKTFVWGPDDDAGTADPDGAGYLPGALGVSEPGIYRLTATVDGLPQGEEVLVLCRTHF
jgi:hypothetical protein